MKTVRTTTAVVLLLFFTITNVYSQAELCISDQSFRRGETKTVQIEMINSVEICAFQLSVVLPRHMKLASRPLLAQNRIAKIVDEFGNNIQANPSLKYNIDKDGNLIIVVYSTDAVPFAGNEGAIVNLSLMSDGDSPIGTSYIELKNMELVYADGYTSVLPPDRKCKVQIGDGYTSVQELRETVTGAVDVFGTDGVLVVRDVPVESLENTLESGVYLICGRKIMVK